MLEYLPPYYQASRVIEAILSAQGQEIDKLFDTLDQTLEQYFATTATWGLSWWEELLGLPVNEDLPPAERRRHILVKRWGLSQPLLFILQAVEPTLQLKFGAGVLPFIYPAPHSADEYDFASLVPALEVYKPAHEAYSFTLLTPDLSSGYAVFAGHDAGRAKVALQLEAGTARAGRWPRWNSPGHLRVAAATAQGSAATGTCLFPQIGVSVGSALSTVATVIAVPRQGIYLFPEAGQYHASEMPTATTVGALHSTKITLTRAEVTGGCVFPIVGVSIGSQVIASIAMSRGMFSGKAAYVMAGTIHAGEVAA
jgi:hypothetical protein